MNHLMKLIQINHSFQKSVNLQLDLDNYERIGSYIPTRSSIAILKRYWNIVSGKSGESASVLIGPYGKGKSHLLLVLLALLHGLLWYLDHFYVPSPTYQARFRLHRHNK